MAIPDFDATTGLLPPGAHAASWQELVDRFGWNDKRRRILRGLFAAASNLRDAGCRTILLNGSFVTAKVAPKDFDACCDTDGIDRDLIDDRLKQGVDVMLASFGGEIQPSNWPANPRMTYEQFFQQDDRTRIRKGIVALDLKSVPARFD